MKLRAVALTPCHTVPALLGEHLHFLTVPEGLKDGRSCRLFTKELWGIQAVLAVSLSNTHVLLLLHTEQ